MLSQPGSQVSLGTNPFFSAPMEVPDIPLRGSTGGRGAESLKRGRIASPSGVVPPSQDDDVMPPINVSVSHTVASLGLDSLSGSLFPPLGDSAPFSGSFDQLRERGDSVLTQHVVCADVHSIPRWVSSFDPSSLLFPFSDSGFSSLSVRPHLSLPSSSSSSSLLSSTTPSFTVPNFSLPSVVLSVLSAPSTPLAPLLPPSSFSQFPSALPSLAFSSAPSLRLLLLSLLQSLLLFLSSRLLLLRPPPPPGSRLCLLPLRGFPPIFLRSLLPLLRVISLRIRLKYWGFRKIIRLWGVGISRLRVRIFWRISPRTSLISTLISI